MMITAIDFRILNMIQNRLRCAALDRIMPKISMFGNFGVIWILWAAVFMASDMYEYIGQKIILGLALGAIIGNLMLKHLVARPRPFKIDNTRALLIKAPKDFSFPSGHTLSSVISACVLLHTSAVIGIIAVIMCAFILFSRMYLFVHYPSDVLGGISLGIIISEIVMMI